MNSINSLDNKAQLANLFNERYSENKAITPNGVVENGIVDKLSKTTLELPTDSNVKPIEDTLSFSPEFSAALQAKSYVNGGLADVNSFMAMAQQLQRDGILNKDEQIAVEFLAKESPRLDLNEFNAMIRNDNLSREMKGLISQLVQKLQMVNYIAGGIM